MSHLCLTHSGGGMPVTLANVILDDIKAGAAKEHA